MHLAMAASLTGKKPNCFPCINIHILHSPFKLDHSQTVSWFSFQWFQQQRAQGTKNGIKNELKTLDNWMLKIKHSADSRLSFMYEARKLLWQISKWKHLLEKESIQQMQNRQKASLHWGRPRHNCLTSFSSAPLSFSVGLITTSGLLSSWWL